jgi:uncharacterized protein (TIGR02611 family)
LSKGVSMGVDGGMEHASIQSHMTTSTLPEPPPAHLPLPFWVRVSVLTVGWIVVLAGVAGLVLPGPGALTILAGLAILSISSELAHRWMRRALQRWPKLSRRVESFRTRLHDWLHRMVRR